MIKVYTIPEFDRSLVRLSKKYKSLKADYLEFVEKVEKDGVQGVSLGNSKHFQVQRTEIYAPISCSISVRCTLPAFNYFFNYKYFAALPLSGS